MSIPQSFLEEIRNRLSLSEVIGRRIKVMRAGREYKACCPFHHEKTPSFTINNEKQFYHCFGCGAHGDVLKFVMEHDGLSFMEAVEMLSTEAGLEMPRLDPVAADRARQKKDLYALMDAATNWMQTHLVESQNKDVLEYLEKRGLDSKVRDVFRIGFTPSDGQTLRKYLSSEGYSDQEMMDVGLLKASTKGGEPYIFFRDRVMFPVMDRRGRVVAFGGRILPDHMRPQTGQGNFKPPKYINTAETKLFDKGRMLYGEHIARKAAHDGHTLLVTEGYMDVIACYKAGFHGAVAPMGTALTDDQIVSLWAMQGEHGNDPVLCFDGDNAGRRAAARACENVLPLLRAGRSVRFAFLPEGQDPDSMIRDAGKDVFKKVLQASMSMLDFMWSRHTVSRRFDTPESRAGLSKDLISEASRITDAEVQRHYKELIRNRISDAFFKPYDKKNRKRNSKGSSTGYAGKLNKPSVKLRTPIVAKSRMSEKILLATILNTPALFSHVEEAIGRITLEYKSYDDMRQILIVEIENNSDVEASVLRSMLYERGYGEEIDDILCESVYVHAAFSRPEASTKLDISDISRAWHEIFNALTNTDFDQEIKQGWKTALEKADKVQEGRLKDIIQGKNA